MIQTDTCRMNHVWLPRPRAFAEDIAGNYSNCSFVERIDVKETS